MEAPPALEFGDRQSGTAGPFRLHLLLHGRRHHGDVTALFWRLGLASETLLELIEELTEHWLTPTCPLAPAELRQPSSWNRIGVVGDAVISAAAQYQTDHGQGFTCSWHSEGYGSVLATAQCRSRTATPAIYHGKRRHAAAASEFRPPFLNGVQRSVNRKVQGSNPRSGAKSERDPCQLGPRLTSSAAKVQQPRSCNTTVLGDNGRMANGKTLLITGTSIPSAHLHQESDPGPFLAIE